MIILPIVHLKYSFDDQDFPYIVLTSKKYILINRNLNKEYSFLPFDIVKFVLVHPIDFVILVDPFV